MIIIKEMQWQNWWFKIKTNHIIKKIIYIMLWKKIIEYFTFKKNVITLRENNEWLYEIKYEIDEKKTH